MSNFKVGQKVVCIKDDSIDIITGHKNIAPKIDDIVTISGIHTNNWLKFFGYPEIIIYDPKCFRPLDYQFAEDVIAMITEQVKEGELVSVL